MTAVACPPTTANERYLSAALDWLRSRFDALVPTSGAAPEADSGDDGRRLTEHEARADMALLSDDGAVLPDMARRLGLGPFETDLLLLCAAMELDPGMPRRCALAQPASLPYPTFALAAHLFEGASWDALSASGPLRRWRLVDVRPGSDSLITAMLRVDETVVDHIKGLHHLDPRLEPLLLSVPADGSADLPPSLRASAERVTDAWRDVPASEPLPVVQLIGPARAGKELVASRAATLTGMGLVRLSATELVAAGNSDELSSLWRRDSVLLGSCALLDAEDVPTTDVTGAVSRFLASGAGPVLVAARDPLLVRGRPDVVVDVDWPTPAEQRALWADRLPAGSDDLADELAGRFRLDPGRIAVLADRAERRSGQLPLRTWLWRECQAVTRPRLDALALWTHPRATWQDLVLPEAELALLRQIPWHVRRRTLVHDDWGFGDRPSRASGTPALLAGPSGTGKTLAAEVIAGDLQAPLCHVDLSAAVSKYIGETEKNLARLFDAAEESAAVLFFDEADALFGKRSAVRDSHDRYANIETSYLLQRLDRFTGVALLATNTPDALDEAFLRRLRFVVHFPLPGAVERQRMWEQAFPPRVPLDPALDLLPLAALPLTGAVISSIALHAAFVAAAEGAATLTARHLTTATAQELRKVGRRPPDRLWPEETT